MSEREFEGMSLFDAFDMEHAGLINAGISTAWPEELASERAAIQAEVEEVKRELFARRAKG